MLSTLKVNNPSSLRRVLFAHSFLSPDVPKRWEIIADFASRGATFSPCQVESIAENCSFVDSQACVDDSALFQELVHMPYDKRPCLGVVLIYELSSCIKCGAKLLVRSDRPSNLFIYTTIHGTLPAVHYRKYCSRRSCSLVQHYGYYTYGSMGKLYYDQKWETLTYFVSSQVK